MNGCPPGSEPGRCSLCDRRDVSCVNLVNEVCLDCQGVAELQGIVSISTGAAS